MKATISEKKMLLDAYRKEKRADRSKRLQLIIGVRVDGQTITGTAKALHMSGTWDLMAQPLQEGGGERAQHQAEDGQAPVRRPCPDEGGAQGLTEDCELACN